MLTNAIFYTIILQFVRFACGVSRSKIIALHWGPEGLGIFSQAQNMLMLGLTVSSLSMATGYVQRCRSIKNKYNERYYNEIHGTVFLSILVCSILVVTAGFLFSNQLREMIFSQTVDNSLYRIALISLLFTSLSQAYLEPRILSQSEYKYYVFASILSSAFSVFFIGLIAWFDIYNGLAWQIVLSSAGSCFVLIYFCIKKLALNNLLKPSFRWSHFRPILKVSISIVVSGIGFYGSSLFLRSIVLKDLGAAYNGYIQVPMVVAGYYTPIISYILWYVLHPKWSEKNSAKEIAPEIAGAIGRIGIIQTFIVCWIMCFPWLLIRTVYTKDFYAGVKTMPIQFWGDFFYFLLNTVSVYLIAIPRIRIYTILWIMFSALETILGYIFLRHLHLALRAVSLAYAMASFITLAVLGVFILKEFYALEKREFRRWLKRLTVAFLFLSIQCYLLFSSQLLVFRAAMAIGFTLLLWNRGWIEIPEGWKKYFPKWLKL